MNTNKQYVASMQISNQRELLVIQRELLAVQRELLMIHREIEGGSAEILRSDNKKTIKPRALSKNKLNEKTAVLKAVIPGSREISINEMASLTGVGVWVLKDRIAKGEISPKTNDMGSLYFSTEDIDRVKTLKRIRAPRKGSTSTKDNLSLNSFAIRVGRSIKWVQLKISDGDLIPKKNENGFSYFLQSDVDYALRNLISHTIKNFGPVDLWLKENEVKFKAASSINEISDVYNDYVQWSESSGYTPVLRSTLTKELRNKGFFARTVKHGVRVWFRSTK